MCLFEFLLHCSMRNPTWNLRVYSGAASLVFLVGVCVVTSFVRASGVSMTCCIFIIYDCTINFSQCFSALTFKEPRIVEGLSNPNRVSDLSQIRIIEKG